MLYLTKNTIASLRQPSQRCAPQIREQAFVLMIEAYVKAGDAGKAPSFFGSVADGEGEFTALMGKLADGYVAAGNRPQACRAVTAIPVDHGRSADFAHHGASPPEPSRGWLVATGADIAPRGYVRGPPATLADIAPTARRLLGLAADRDPGAGTALAAFLR